MKFFAWFNQRNNHDSKKKRNIDNTNVHDTKGHVHDDRNSWKKRSNAPITKDNQQTGNTRDTRYIPDSVRQEVFERDGRRCANCGSTFYLEFDHIIPIAKGGATSVKNLQVLCRQCNRKKGLP